MKNFKGVTKYLLVFHDDDTEAIRNLIKDRATNANYELKETKIPNAVFLCKKGTPEMNPNSVNLEKVKTAFDEIRVPFIICSVAPDDSSHLSF